MSEVLFTNDTMTYLNNYLDTLQAHLQAGNATEHTHRPALQNLLTALLPNYRITNEPHRIACGSPDFGITRGEVFVRPLEARNIEAGLNKV
jgi:hypothetical protein